MMSLGNQNRITADSAAVPSHIAAAARRNSPTMRSAPLVSPFTRQCAIAGRSRSGSALNTSDKGRIIRLPTASSAKTCGPEMNVTR